MNCPACNKNLASTLSVCPGCGTMVNDSVREELALKIAPIIKLPKIEPPKVENSKIELKEKSVFIPPISAPLIELAKPMIYNSLTGEIKAKPTAPTLVEFHNKNAAVPEWRLQLQNSVRMRNEQRNLTDNSTTSAVQSAPHRANLVTNGATALKAETLEKIEPVISANPIIASNPTLANAMRRIEESRQRFLVEEIQSAVPKNTVQTAPKTFPHAVPNKPQESFLKRSSETDAEFSSKPIFVPAFSDSQVKFDTNKLPPLPSLDKPSISITKVDLNVEDDDFLEIHKTASPDVTAYGENQILEIEGVDEPEEFDDCAPISLRFNAAVFDLIIGSFASLILLSPFYVV